MTATPVTYEFGVDVSREDREGVAGVIRCAADVG
jgi:hypothetical protein